MCEKHDGKKSTRECKNSKTYIRKCKIRKFLSLQNVFLVFLLLKYKISSFLLLNKTAQPSAQRVIHNKIYWKIELSLCFGFVKQAGNKVQKRIQAISRDIPLTHKSLYQKGN